MIQILVNKKADGKSSSSKMKMKTWWDRGLQYRTILKRPRSAFCNYDKIILWFVSRFYQYKNIIQFAGPRESGGRLHRVHQHKGPDAALLFNLTRRADAVMPKGLIDSSNDFNTTPLASAPTNFKWVSRRPLEFEDFQTLTWANCPSGTGSERSCPKAPAAPFLWKPVKWTCW